VIKKNAKLFTSFKGVCNIKRRGGTGDGIGMNKLISEVREKLRAKEIRFTVRRELVLKAFLENSDKHLSAEEVYNLVKIKVPDMGLATVYRTLELFMEFDFIHAIDFGDGRKRYELGAAEEDAHRHHHLICTKCGDIIEVNEDLLEELENRVNKQHDFVVTDHQLQIFGICKKCISKR